MGLYVFCTFCLTDPAVMIELELAEYAADEGDNVSIVVTKTGRNTKPVTVAVSTEDETATSKHCRLSRHSGAIVRPL